MAKTQKRILIVIDTEDDTDTLSGISQTDATGSPQPLDIPALIALTPEINTAALEEIEALKEQLANAQNSPPAVPTTGVTKLTIMRRLGPKWPTLKSALTQLPDEVQDAWLLALEILPDDPLLVAYRDDLQQMLDLTTEEFDALLV